MLTYSFDNTGGLPLYEYLYRCIRDDILSGELKADDRLPSKRAFARHLGISTITIENAYAQLLTEGYVISRARTGYFVADLGDRQQSAPLRPSAGASFTSPKNTPFSSSSPYETEPASWYANFSSNQTAAENFPFSVWARLTRMVLQDRREELMINPPLGGVWELREAIAEHLRRFRGINADPQQILIGAGTEYLYGLLIQLLGFDKLYAVEDPGYRKLDRIFLAHRVRCLPIPLDESGLLVNDLAQSGADVVHVTPSHHFPTGITMPAPRRMELLSWARGSERRFILEDDYDSEFRLNGRPLPSLFSLDRSGKVIYLNTFTKSLSSTIRISYMVLPKPLLHDFAGRLGFYSCTVPTFEQYVLATFIREGYFEKHVNRMRSLSRKKRDQLLSLLESSPIRALCSISEENAGLHFLLNLRLSGDPSAFLKRLEESGIRITGLKAYQRQDEKDEKKGMRLPGDHLAEHTFVMNYSSVPQEHMAEALRRIEAAVLAQEKVSAPRPSGRETP